MFNLLPVPPLDGSRILGSLHPPFARLWQHEQAQFLGLFLFLGIFFFGGPIIFGFAFETAGNLLHHALALFVPGAV
jgi:Zn-dependent protease